MSLESRSVEEVEKLTPGLRSVALLLPDRAQHVRTARAKPTILPGFARAQLNARRAHLRLR